MRLPAALVLACVATLLAAGCGTQEGPTPSACLEGADAYVRALSHAPGAVRLSDGTAISECLTVNQEGGELATVGGAMVEAATRLSAEAREDPGGDAGLRLGYLVGAAQRGGDETEGIHADLIRRLAVAARYAPGHQPLPPAFLRAYRQGYDSGHTRG